MAITSDLGVVTVVAGAGGETDQGISQCGAVYVFRTTDDGATWQQTARLTNSDTAAYDAVGSSVAISGNIIVAGAPPGGPGDSGFVCVVRTDDGGATWTQVSKVYAADGAYQDLLGRYVAVDGALLVAGALLADAGSEDSNEGAAYVFRTDDNGASWTQVAKLTARDAAANDQFGSSVAIASNVLAIGSKYDDDGGSASGSVYLYQTSDDGATWYEIVKLRASDAAQTDVFSQSVAISGGGRVVVGAYDDNGGSNSGSVYIFDTPAPTPQPTTAQPTPGPTPWPTPAPSPRPTPWPTVSPTPAPSPAPSPRPSSQPTSRPTPAPSPAPTPQPTS